MLLVGSWKRPKRRIWGMIGAFVYVMIFVAVPVTVVGLTVVSFLYWIKDRVGNK
jgi:hypothetical protein